ncbi:hypothetical protein V6N13_018949 [Hibiscus sabdariffa]
MKTSSPTRFSTASLLRWPFLNTSWAATKTGEPSHSSIIKAPGIMTSGDNQPPWGPFNAWEGESLGISEVTKLSANGIGTVTSRLYIGTAEKVPLPPSQLVDTTGAGDAFIGALVYVFVEKILRVQPNVKKLYLVVRAADHKSATHRLHNEIIGKDLFRNLKEKHGKSFTSFISDKISVIPGDISRQDLGVQDSGLIQQISKDVEVVLNLAATTNFDERYDVALGLNTMGVKYVVEFAKQCVKLQVLVHVSTAYVSGERSGLILENGYSLGETLNGVGGLDINMETKVVDDKLNDLRLQGASDKDITIAMKDLGIHRFLLFYS